MERRGRRPDRPTSPHDGGREEHCPLIAGAIAAGARAGKLRHEAAGQGDAEWARLILESRQLSAAAAVMLTQWAAMAGEGDHAGE